MKTNHRLFGFHLLVIFALGTSFNCYAQRSVAPRKVRVVDEVTLQTGVKLFGIVGKSDSESGTEILVERQWYAKTYPKRYAAHLTKETAAQQQARQGLLIRLEQWKATRNQPKDEKLNRFIDAEIERLGVEEGADGESTSGSSQFTWVHVPANEVRNVYQQTPGRHRIANLAWAHKIKGVSVRSAAALTKELEKKNVKPDADAVDLSGECPAKPQSVEEWNTRVAICEFTFRKRMHFQGVGSTLMKVGANDPANQAGLLQQMLMGGGAQEILKDLLGDVDPANGKDAAKEDAAWWSVATDAAEEAGCRGVRVTRLIQDFTSPVAKVEEFFLAEIEPGKWKPVFTTIAKSDRDKIARGDADFLKQDPQIEGIMGALDGLGTGNDALLDKALRQGAATQQAMENAEASILDFVDEYSQHVDGPAWLN